MEKIIGRLSEIAILKAAQKSKDAGLIAMYGRRRVGKTYLIRNFFQDHLAFEMTGMYNSGLKEHLRQFTLALQKSTGSLMALKDPETWIDAFYALQQFLSTNTRTKKMVIFLDEFPWLDSRKSGFLPAFEHFWNSYASRQSNLLVIICGSAASWMIRNIVNNKGGLHNRITQKIRLLPFTLKETERYLKSRGSNLDRYQVLLIYMAMGGIPQYLKIIDKGNSAAQAIDKACFTKDGLLTGEFDNLYSSLFETSENHLKVVRALARTPKGLTRQEIIDACYLNSGGTTSLMLEELQQSGFIAAMIPFDKAGKDAVYRLIDEFSIFYLKFMDKKKSSGNNTWLKLSTGAVYKAWSGMAFEAVCLKHVGEIKKHLGIEAVETQESAWRYIAAKEAKTGGAQIDLLIDRNDRVVNICEMKFYADLFTIDKSYAAALVQKINVFQGRTKTRKTIFLTMITTYGLTENNYSEKLVQQSITMDALFGT